MSSPDETFRARVPLCDIVLHDAEGTEICLWCRVEQVAVDKANGAHHGNQAPISLRPHLVRVLDQAPVGD